MAITHYKPIKEWYTESTSQWTLDYPPFFAYFEYLMSFAAKYFDPKMLNIQSKPYESYETIFFLRLTVIITDLVFYYGVFMWIKLIYEQKQNVFARVPSISSASRSDFFLSSTPFIQIALFVFNVGHLIVDNIHFQYNGFLDGLMLISMAYICSGRIYLGSFWFAVLLNFKHIYLYIAPAYFIYLLIDHCLDFDSNDRSLRIRFKIFLTLAFIVSTVFALSFGPFVLNNQFGQLLSRLFPFQRGISHAYWAPNFWALYNTIDLIGSKLLQRKSSFTGGLVKQSKHSWLPDIQPSHSIILIVSIISLFNILEICFFKICFPKLVTLVYSRKRKQEKTSGKFGADANVFRSEIRFLHFILFSSLTFYQFGYHVHEKSIILPLTTLIPLIFVKIDYARLFLLLSLTGYYSLFPLLFKPMEALVKVISITIHLIFSLVSFRYLHEQISYLNLSQQYRTSDLERIKTNFKIEPSKWMRLSLLSPIESLYCIGFILVQLIYSIGPFVLPTVFQRYQFLPLLMVSMYCSIGTIYSFFIVVQIFFQNLTF
ncbi:dolichyl pyrophosphate Glc1Man9GlcNAc2 alpha-1,3-glucosyltransferase-like protein [Sarcoptes scabiei]|uniref:Alpha-1,3-glucosyltransferase n=1 Tax=Sarcoptes scabiei TaxID=52283 RepID=A0A132AHB0_SARSC|nr:dolichyl pyrophosphate Glc1Man9GlcNAc2 alpha-1,3-glucosyltransferase-like protein [Sarcoptes scabiei]